MAPPEEEAAELTHCPREDHGNKPCYCAEKARTAVAERLRQRDAEGYQMSAELEWYRERVATLEAALTKVRDGILSTYSHHWHDGAGWQASAERKGVEAALAGRKP